MGHSLRACLVGMHLAERLGIPLAESRDLYFALLLKDAGATSIAPILAAHLDGDDRHLQREMRRIDAAPTRALAALATRGPVRGRPWPEYLERVLGMAWRGPALAREIA